MLVAAQASQDRRRKRATAGGKRATARDAGSDAVAAEAQDLVRRAVGDAAGLTIKAQVRQAARNLGFTPESWRPREAFYGRAGGWGAAALDDMRRRFAAWEAGRSAGPVAERLAAVRQALARLQAEMAALDAEVVRLLGGGASDA